MFRILRDIRQARRSTFLTGAVGAAVILSLLTPSAASAAEYNPRGGESPQSSELTHEQIASVTDRQITAANSGTDKFSSADLVEKVRKQIEADYEAREKRRAEEAAARAKAEEEARIAAEEAARVEAERIAAERAAEAQKSTQQYSAPSGPAAYSGGGSKDEWLRAAGIAESDWAYVDYIVSRESGWNPNAVNGSSGASGLVQALPCGKVPGSCFDPVDNLRWANGYATGRYGSWASAYEFWVNNHWW